MAMNEIMKWQKQIEASKRRVQKRQDVRDLRTAGVYSNGYDHYINEDGYPFDGVDTPWWFKNLQKAWKSKAEQKNQVHGDGTDVIPKSWDEYCEGRVDLLGEEFDPRKVKPNIGRPKLPAHLKKNPSKIKRSDQMKLLLQEDGITVNSDGTIVNYEGWIFCPNGRIKFENEPTISTYEFIKLYG